MIQGEKINITENRAALHTASRNFSDTPVFIDGKDIMPEIRHIRQEIKDFTEKIHSGKIMGSTGKPFQHAVVIGIGGSYLGTEFVSEALRAFANKGIDLHYLANVDIHNFGRLTADIDPETTLWIVVSKSYTTAETSANTQQMYIFMKEKGLDPSKHIDYRYSKRQPPEMILQTLFWATFYMFGFYWGAIQCDFSSRRRTIKPLPGI